MKPATFGGTGAALALMALVAFDTAPAQEMDPGICTRTARQLYQSCISGVHEERRLGLAHCLNVPAKVERRECFTGVQEDFLGSRAECPEVRASRWRTCALLGEDLYTDPMLDPDREFVDPDEIPGTWAPNPYLDLTAGITSVIRIVEEGEFTEEFVVQTVTGDTEEINGADCRVVIDAELEYDGGEDGEAPDYIPLEVTDDFYAQDTLGNVIYCGEVSRGYEDEFLSDLDGSFLAGVDHAKAGFLIKAVPVAGEVHRQEYALDEAEDVIEYLSLAGAPDEAVGGNNQNAGGQFSCGEHDCLQAREFNPMEPGGDEQKFFLRGTGFVLAVAYEDGEFADEREELVCQFGSLEAFWTDGEAECGIEDMDELREDLCELSPDGFCDEDD